MSYLSFPRIHFSGQFKAYPATINNFASNYKPSIYPNIEKVQLVWAPKGTGEITPVGCTVTMVEYEDGSSAISPDEDPIIGQPFFAIQNPNFIAGALVDLDPDQQGVSEIWGMKIQIGGEDAYIRGDFAPAAFNSVWANAKLPNPPQSSASSSVTYQSVLTGLETNGLENSRFLDYFAQNPASKLSINFKIDAHNNNPVLYSFNKTTFQSLASAGVTQEVLDKIEPMQHLSQQKGMTLGDIPTKDFVTFQLQQYLNKGEYNASIDNILQLTQVEKNHKITPHEFAHGFMCGTVGTSTPDAPKYFVPSRMLAPLNRQFFNFAPFSVSHINGQISINLSNSLAVKHPGTILYEEAIGQLHLVHFHGEDMSIGNAIPICEIDYMEPGFLAQRGGMFTTVVDDNISDTPLGIISTLSDGSQSIVLAENKDGYYLRANQYVFRMNPGVETTIENPRGNTAKVDIHVLKFGEPVPDGTQITMATITSRPSKSPERNTGVPENALSVSPSNGIAETENGIASFILTASDPKNPRVAINGQVYFKSYGFTDGTISAGFIQDPTDFISIQVYNLHPDIDDAIDILNKYGYLYKIMGFLTDDQTVEGMGKRNMIKTLLQRPFSDIRHMPVTRDLSIANRKKIIDWIDQLNSSSSQAPIA